MKPVVYFKAPFLIPRFSPEGRRIAYQCRGLERRLYIYDLDRGIRSPVTGDGWAGSEVWTPDGKRLIFGWFKQGPQNIYWQPVDGSSPMEQLASAEGVQVPVSLSPDGSTLAFVEFRPETRWDILLLNMKTRRATPFLDSKAQEYHPEISPDGQWLAYTSDESGRVEVWVRPFPGQGGKWQISNEGGHEALWSKDGRRLFYRRQDQAWVVDVRTDAGFAAGKPRLLFKQRFGMTWPSPNWDLAPDGGSFLMVKPEETRLEPVTEMILVQNWLEELKRLLPTGK
jgi:Tol biopolymer transport system component